MGIGGEPKVEKAVLLGSALLVSNTEAWGNFWDTHVSRVEAEGSDPSGNKQ